MKCLVIEPDAVDSPSQRVCFSMCELSAKLSFVAIPFHVWIEVLVRDSNSANARHLREEGK